MRKDHSFRNKNRYYTIIENIKSWNEMTIRNFFFFFCLVATRALYGIESKFLKYSRFILEKKSNLTLKIWLT